MANLRLKQVFGRWSDDNKVKAFNAIADDDLKSMLASDKEKAFETFKNKLGEEEFNAAFDSYYQTIKPAKKETSKKEHSKIEELNNEFTSILNSLKSLSFDELNRIIVKANLIIDKKKEDEKKAIEAKIQELQKKLETL